MQLLEQRRHGSRLQYQITAGRGVPGNISKCPHGLFADIIIGTEEQLYKNGHGTHFHNNLGMLTRSRGNIRQCPRRLKLQSGVVIPLQKLYKAGHDTRINHLLNRRIFLNGQQSTELRGALRLNSRIISHYTLNHLRQILKFAAPSGRSTSVHGRHVHSTRCTGVSPRSDTSGSEHACRGKTGGCGIHAGSGRGHLTTFGQADIFFGFTDLEGGLLSAAAAFVDVDGLFEALLALFFFIYHHLALSFPSFLW
mmetsp:Transcript_1098/g.1812  ORF Transcript_1098/g.1812 Transcript_1098/m.1812 type:complete len:252 (+) Transcript_1098:3757-4512(+)